jgi:RNA polymerase sigma factor (sigma-70 family)
MNDLMDEIQINSDCSVIEKVLDGNIALFEVLVRRYNAVLYRIAKSYGYKHQDCEDLMQDTHIIAYTQLKKFEGRSSYKTWISRIMINKCLYNLKYGYFKNEVPTESIREPNNNSMPISPNANQPESILMNRELANTLEKSIQTLPLLLRTVFIFREVEGFSVQETADLLSITPINVKVRLNRAKALLRKEIEQLYSHKELYAFNLIYCDGIAQKVMEQVRKLEDKP